MHEYILDAAQQNLVCSHRTQEYIVNGLSISLQMTFRIISFQVPHFTKESEAGSS